ncbi:MAG: hypothetical protein JXC32_01510 [Anaerolineae bacterium]|nr:hypothetical protein [Anaerolineae bacterium]
MGDTLGLIIGAVMTILIFSYLLGDNILYRWALAILVGSAAGYALGIAIQFVMTEWISVAIASTGGSFAVTYAVPLLLGSLLIFKGFPPTRLLARLSVLGNIPLGYLVGVGAAVAVAGALTGTLLPQMLATGQALRLDAGVLGIVEGLIVMLATITVLLFFTARPKEAAPTTEETAKSWRQRIQGVGKVLLFVGLGAALAGAISSALTALVIRLWHLADLVGQLTPLLGG